MDVSTNPHVRVPSNGEGATPSHCICICNIYLLSPDGLNLRSATTGKSLKTTARCLIGVPILIMDLAAAAQYLGGRSLPRITNRLLHSVAEHQVRLMGYVGPGPMYTYHEVRQCLLKIVDNLISAGGTRYCQSFSQNPD